MTTDKLHDLASLKSGWKLGFGDDDEFIDYFFTHYDSNHTRIVRRNSYGDIVAQLHYFLFTDELCDRTGCYIYGITTLPTHRGQGLAKSMINEALSLLRANGTAYAVLIAEDTSLQSWYGSLGFELHDATLDIRGAEDGMNFATDTVSLNKGMYYVLDDTATRFTTNIRIAPAH